tara:strand:+ start:263 stop:1678 length:1416 start_codon:yes stop_codon:yes gene_type:complete
MLKTLLKVHQDTEDIDFKSIWSEGLFVFDSNVLLDLYRLPESASNDLIKVLNNKDVNRKIWIGFQVIIEFLNNRHEAISDQKNKFNTVRSLIEDKINQYDDIFNSLSEEISKLKLKQRHSLIDPEKFITEENISSGKKFLEAFIEELSVLESKQSDVNDEDKIKNVVLKIFKGKIGEPFTKNELENIYKSGEKRYENNVPPGYKDKAKKGIYKIEDKDFVRKYGDLILWKEIIKKASEENYQHIVLVTGDVKEDWWLEKRGKKLGPRKELLNEIYTEAPNVKTFYMYDTSSFLKYAKSELMLEVSDSSISQVKDLIERGRNTRFVNEEGYVFLPDMIKDLVSQIGELRVGIGRSVYSLPPVAIRESALYVCLMEILYNVRDHGAQSYVGVQANRRDDQVLIRFKNRVGSDNNIKTESVDSASVSRGYGAENIATVMHKEGVDVRIHATRKTFVVELYVPIEKFYRAEGEIT